MSAHSVKEEKDSVLLGVHRSCREGSRNRRIHVRQFLIFAIAFLLTDLVKELVLIVKISRCRLIFGNIRVCFINHTCDVLANVVKILISINFSSSRNVSFSTVNLKLMESLLFGL